MLDDRQFRNQKQPLILSQDDLGVIVTTSTSPPATRKVPNQVHMLVRSCRNTTLEIKIPR